MHGVMFHTPPKKYKKSPEELWRREPQQQTPNQMLNAILSLASNGEEVRREMMKRKK